VEPRASFAAELLADDGTAVAPPASTHGGAAPVRGGRSLPAPVGVG
jgi:hypothetical protein